MLQNLKYTAFLYPSWTVMAWMCGQLQVKTGWLVNSTQRTVTTPYHRDLYWDLSCLIACQRQESSRSTLSPRLELTLWAGPGNLLKSTGAIQSDPHRLEEWGNQNVMKFNKDKSKCLQLKKKKSPSMTGCSQFCEDF